MEARGMNGQLYFDGQFVTLTRKGFWARSQIGLGEKRIPVTSIGSVQWKPASKIGINGYIQFSTVGDVQRRPRYGQRNLDAARDESAVTFRYGQMPAFEELRVAIERAITTSRGATAPAYSPLATPGDQRPPDARQQLQRLAQLWAEGLISEQEYQAKRAEIIARL